MASMRLFGFEVCWVNMVFLSLLLFLFILITLVLFKLISIWASRFYLPEMVILLQELLKVFHQQSRTQRMLLEFTLTFVILLVKHLTNMWLLTLHSHQVPNTLWVYQGSISSSTSIHGWQINASWSTNINLRGILIVIWGFREIDWYTITWFRKLDLGKYWLISKWLYFTFTFLDTVIILIGNYYDFKVKLSFRTY